MCSSKIIKFNFRDPRRNLSPKLYRKRGESNFVGSFERTFLQENPNGFGGRQFAVSGFGIADFFWVNLPSSPLAEEENNDPFEFLKNQTIMAFEMKLTDWKRALYQAYRYSYYANTAVVVLPKEKLGNASNHIELFKELKIGLWGLDSKSKTITRFFTPESRTAKSENAREKAFKLIFQKISKISLKKNSLSNLSIIF